MRCREGQEPIHSARPSHRRRSMRSENSNSVRYAITTAARGGAPWRARRVSAWSRSHSARGAAPFCAWRRGTLGALALSQRRVQRQGLDLVGTARAAVAVAARKGADDALAGQRASRRGADAAMGRDVVPVVGGDGIEPPTSCGPLRGV
jgi:hypothetical protein